MKIIPTDQIGPIKKMEVLYVLFPLLNDMLSFSKGALRLTNGQRVFLSHAFHTTGTIYANEVWRAMWAALENASSGSPDDVRAFVRLSHKIDISEENPGTQLLVYYPGKSFNEKSLLHKTNKLISFAMYRAIPLRVPISSPSDRAFFDRRGCLVVNSDPEILKAFFDEGIFYTIRNKMPHFDWNEKLFFATLPLTRTLDLMGILMHNADATGCVAIPRIKMINSMIQRFNISRGEAFAIVDNLTNKRYRKLFTRMTRLLKRFTGSGDVDDERLSALLQWDRSLGPDSDANLLPFIETDGILFTSLALMHETLIEQLMGISKSQPIRRGYKFEDFISGSLAGHGFDVVQRLRIKTNEPIQRHGRSIRTLEYDIIAYRDPILLCVQCKSYAKNYSYPHIERICGFWYECVNHLKGDITAFRRMIEKRNPMMSENMRRGSIRLVIPLVVTEDQDLGVINGCLVCGALNFHTELEFIAEEKALQQLEKVLDVRRKAKDRD